MQFVPLPLWLQRLFPCRPQSTVALTKLTFSTISSAHWTTNNSRMTFRAPFTMQHQETIFPWYTEDRLKCIYRADTALACAQAQSLPGKSFHSALKNIILQCGDEWFSLNSEVINKELNICEAKQYRNKEKITIYSVGKWQNTVRKKAGNCFR